jgi:beta-phosphoglucomutase family hydrolase
MEIRGLIFDCDGTLADTMPLHWIAWDTVAKQYGLHFTEERFYALGGVPSRDIFKMLGEEQGIVLDPIKASHDKESAYLPLLPQVTAIPAVLAIAQEYYGQVPMAVASGGTKQIITQVLEHLKIAHMFDAVVTSEDVKHQKPAPDIFLEAARRLGVDPQYCQAFEDAELGLQAIRAAGMHLVDVRPMYKR